MLEYSNTHSLYIDAMNLNKRSDKKEQNLLKITVYAIHI